MYSHGVQDCHSLFARAFVSTAGGAAGIPLTSRRSYLEAVGNPPLIRKGVLTWLMWLIRGVKPIALHQGGDVQMNQINECCKEQEEAPAAANQGASCLVYFGNKWQPNDNRKNKQIYTSGLNDCFPFMLEKKKLWYLYCGSWSFYTIFFGLNKFSIFRKLGKDLGIFFTAGHGTKRATRCKHTRSFSPEH